MTDTLGTFGHPMATMSGPARTLWASAWDQLSDAADTARHGWHLPVLGTTASGAGRDRPELRTVVLRWVNQDQHVVGCHTDARSPKVAELDATGWAAWLFYDPGLKLQLRVSGPTVVERDTPRADERWAASTLSSRRCYLAPGGPSSVIDEPGSDPPPNLPESVRDRVPTQAEAEPGRANFASIATTITRMEVLSLAHDGHERLSVRWPGDDPSAEPRWAWLLP